MNADELGGNVARMGKREMRSCGREESKKET
jgi:hypothetical protein